MKRPLRVEILGTGDELLRGRSRDTNYAELAGRMTDAGLEVVGGSLRGDDLGRLVAALRAAAARADAVVVTGGLGPTADDLTREAAARLLRVPLVESAANLRRIESFWRGRSVPMPASNRLQALLPRGAKSLRNAVGTAPGFRFRWRGTLFFCLPGPPREMLPMFERAVLPALAGRASKSATRHVSCAGVPESVVAERIADLMARNWAVGVGTTAGGGVVTVSVHGRGAAAREVPEVHREILRRLGDDAYAAERIPPGEHLARLLIGRGVTISVAESCTAGLVAARLADRPGSSGALLGGVVAYSNGVKEKILGVPRRLLRVHGAVSGPVAAAMAEGVRRLTGSDVAVAVTGIAGPGGGSARKPVGLVWFAVATARGTTTHRRRYGGDRGFIRTLAAHAALDLVRRALASCPVV